MTSQIALAGVALALALSLVLAGCGSDDRGGTVPTAAAPAPTGKATVSEVTIGSEAVGRELGISVIEPSGSRREKRPLLVLLHGAGGSSQSFVANEAVLGGLAALGARAPVLAFPEGEESWWHDRASGEWGRYVVREVIPTISRRYGTDPHRVAIGGISMGGFGAYHLGLAYPRRFCAVGGHSAGLWLDPSAEFPGAFDDQSDYERNDVLAAVEANPDAFGSARVWNDYGDQDWFVAGNAAFVAALGAGDADLSAQVWPGGHDSAYWDAHWPAYLRFYATSLARCR